MKNSTGNANKKSTKTGRNDKVLAKKGKLKRYREKAKQCRQNRTFQNNERKFYQQPDAKEAKRFWSKIWQPRELNKKAEWISNMSKDLEGLKERPKTEIHIDLLRMTQKITNWKTPGHDGINTWSLVQKIHHHSWQTSTRNEQMSSTSTRTWMDYQRKDHIDSKRSP